MKKALAIAAGALAITATLTACGGTNPTPTYQTAKHVCAKLDGKFSSAGWNEKTGAYEDVYKGVCELPGYNEYPGDLLEMEISDKRTHKNEPEDPYRRTFIMGNGQKLILSMKRPSYLQKVTEQLDLPEVTHSNAKKTDNSPNYQTVKQVCGKLDGYFEGMDDDDRCRLTEDNKILRIKIEDKDTARTQPADPYSPTFTMGNERILTLHMDRPSDLEEVTEQLDLVHHDHDITDSF